MNSELRKVKTYRVKNSIHEKVDIIAKDLCLDTSFFNINKHTRSLGYNAKGKVSTADVLEIAVNNLYDQVFPSRK